MKEEVEGNRSLPEKFHCVLVRGSRRERRHYGCEAEAAREAARESLTVIDSPIMTLNAEGENFSQRRRCEATMEVPNAEAARES
ncbi:hypothetical protein COP2_026396 [Malus domestica]